jgi:hypothetical protein
MRKTIPLLIAVALTAAAPASAQGTENNVAADTAVATNDIAPTDNLAVTNDVVVDPANDPLAVPVVTEEAADTTPAPAKKRGFPWGVLGLLGLVGLLGRKRG